MGTIEKEEGSCKEKVLGIAWLLSFEIPLPWLYFLQNYSRGMFRDLHYNSGAHL
ncbi:hypothetical protein OKW21_004284 [Catalinimonas alkaloidigena]|nr:hypothetical protein [Catalinimonas alkaloidigena]